MTDKPKLAITYCTQCNWLLRAAWMGQEVLSTFGLEMGEVSAGSPAPAAFSRSISMAS